MLRKKLTNIFIIIAIMAFIKAVYTIMLGRALPKQDMGIVSFIFSSSGLVIGFAMLGQHTALTRFFSNNAPADYNWKKWFKNFLCAGGFITIISAVVIYKFYHLSLPYSVLFILIVFSFLAIKGYSGLLRSQGILEKAIFFTSLPNLVFAFFIILGMIFMKPANASLVIICYTIAAVISAYYISRHTTQKIKYGIKPIPKGAYIDGAILFVSSVSMYVLTTSDRLFIAKMLSFEDLAIFSVTFSIMVIFNLGAETLWFVMMPHFAKVGSINFKKIYAYLLVVATATSIFYMLFGDKILSILFDGKYDEGKFLIPYFVIIGVIRLFNQVPSSIISGRLRQNYLKIFLYLTIATLILNLILNYYFIGLWKLKGAAMATIICWLMYFIGGWVVVLKGLRSENIAKESQ